MSLLWTSDHSATINEVQRWFLLVSALLTFSLAARAWGGGGVVAGMAVAAVGISAYGLATRLLPLTVTGSGHANSVNRLTDPLGYWNALGAVAAVGLIICCSCVARGGVVVRMASAVGIVVLAPVLYLTFSRGSVLSVAGGLVVVFVLASNRIRLLFGAVGALPAAGLSLAVIHRSPALTNAFPKLGQQVTQGRRACVFLVLVAVLGGVFAALWPYVVDAVAGWQSRHARAGRALRLAFGVLATCAVVAIAFAGSGAAAHLAETWDSSSPHFAHGDLNLRYLSLSADSRGGLWGSAWSVFMSHPVLGSGDGSFGREWLLQGHLPRPTTAAHSLYLETAAELGAIGLALLVFLSVQPLAAAIQLRSRSFTAAIAAGVVVAILSQAAIDWTWDTVAVAGLAMAAIASVLAVADEVLPRIRASLAESHPATRTGLDRVSADVPRERGVRAEVSRGETSGL